MLQPPGDLGLPEEAAQALGVAVAAGLEELQRHLAIQLGVAGQEDLAQGPRGVEAQVAILGPRGGRLPARRRRSGSASVPRSRSPCRSGGGRAAATGRCDGRAPRPARGRWSRAPRPRGSGPARAAPPSAAGTRPVAGRRVRGDHGDTSPSRRGSEAGHLAPQGLDQPQPGRLPSALDRALGDVRGRRPPRPATAPGRTAGRTPRALPPAGPRPRDGSRSRRRDDRGRASCPAGSATPRPMGRRSRPATLA